MQATAHNRILAIVALVGVALFALLAAADSEAANCATGHAPNCKRKDYRDHSPDSSKAAAKARAKAKARRGKAHPTVAPIAEAVNVSLPVSSGNTGGSNSGGTTNGAPAVKGSPTKSTTPSTPSTPSTPVVTTPTEPTGVTKPVEEIIKPIEEVVGGAVGETCMTLAAIAQSNWAPSCWRPYSNSSPWNQTVSPTAPSTANSTAVVQRLASWGPAQNLMAGNSESGSDYYHPIYFATATDPVYRLEPTRKWGTSQIAGESIPIPAEARPADGGDAHMSVITPEGWEYDFWDVESKPANGGTLTFGWGGKTRIDGDGLGSNATAAHFGLAAGVIRAPELEAGHIDHALFMAVKCTDASTATVYPAAAGTSDACSSQEGISNANAPAMGARFVLQMSDAEIAALGVPSWKKTILTAMAHYGMFVGDAFGGESWGLQFESGSTYTSFGAEDRLASFARREGIPAWHGQYVFELNSGVPWQSKLRVVAPCYTERTC
jgi:hypothetical protein